MFPHYRSITKASILIRHLLAQQRKQNPHGRMGLMCQSFMLLLNKGAHNRERGIIENKTPITRGFFRWKGKGIGFAM